MKKAFACLLLITLCLPLAGCMNTVDPEHQSYAITLSIDMMPDNLIMVGVQIPTIGGESGESEGGGDSGGEGGSYIVSTATAKSVTEELNLLDATLPNKLRLSQLKSIVISEKMAKDDRFIRVIDEMSQTYKLYGAASVIICRDEANKFLEQQKPIIGVRLSSSLTAELEHYSSLGYIPSTSLFDLYTAVHAPYSDPILPLAASAKEQESGSSDSSAANGDSFPGNLPRTGDNKNEYMGCALISKGKMVGELTGLECQWLQILRGSLKQINYSFDGKWVRFIVNRNPSVRVECKPDTLSVHLNATIGVASSPPVSNIDHLQKTVHEELTHVIRKCQVAGVEPFGIAGKAAGQFSTVQAFAEYALSEKFADATVRLTVEIKEVSL